MIKRIISVFIISIFLLFTGCSQNNVTVVTTAKKNDVSENETTINETSKAKSTEPSEQTKQSSDSSTEHNSTIFEHLTLYTNEDYKISISYPEVWKAFSATEDEEGLNVTVSSDDYAALIYLFVKNIDPEVATIEDYKTKKIALYEGLFGTAVITEDTIQLNGATFLKLAIKNPYIKTYQFVYTAYMNDCIYEITISLNASEYKTYKQFINKFEKSIRVFQEETLSPES